MGQPNVPKVGSMPLSLIGCLKPSGKAVRLFIAFEPNLFAAALLCQIVSGIGHGGRSFTQDSFFPRMI